MQNHITILIILHKFTDLGVGLQNQWGRGGAHEIILNLENNSGCMKTEKSLSGTTMGCTKKEGV